ncbi:hypothetical protein SNE40_013266 [Patella caerulea]|uniref:Uncharacterized protein n=1 Tax=Patella caerulea TaxID=87958 RepID=A0AAN8JKM5_PATCE
MGDQVHAALLSEPDLKELESEAEEYFNNKEFEKAVEKYGSILAGRGSENVTTLLKRAECYMNLKLYQNAHSDAKHALRMEPKNLDVIIMCGQACIELLLFEEALNYFQDGLKIDAKNKTITTSLKTLHQKIVKDFTIKGRVEEQTYNALKFCSQDPYPGDSDTLNQEYEILSSKYHIPGEEKILAYNQQEAAWHATQAFRIRGKSLSQAIAECSIAVSKDPTNIVYRQLRGDMWLEKDESLKALSDFWAIPKGQRSYDVWKVGGTILRTIDLPISAEFWFRKATKLSPPNDEEAATLFQQVRVERLYGPLTSDFPVKVEFRQFGRGLYAKEDIKEGDLAFVDSPVVKAQVIRSNHEITACNHCARSLLTAAEYFGDMLKDMKSDERELVDRYWPNVTPIYCEDCKKVKYCSDDCRLEAYDLYHQIICPKKNPASIEIYDLIDNDGWGYRADGSRGEIWAGHYSILILSNIWASIIVEAKRLMFKDGLSTPTTEHWARAKAPYRRFIAYGTTSVTKRMPDMLPVFQRVFKQCGDGVSFDVTAEEFNGRYYQATCNLQEFSARTTPYHIFMTNLSMDERMRGLKMVKYLEKASPYASFCGMFPLHACLNHSCCNNVEIRDGDCSDRPGVHVVAKKFIKAGEELFTTYIDSKLRRNLRRAWLYKSFNFWCLCPRCKFEGDDSNVCTNCNVEAEEDKQFPGCSKCKRAWYCSVKCQKDSWKRGHKAICNYGHSDVAGSILPVPWVDNKYI